MPINRKIINDPVHGFVTITDPLVLQLINEPSYQRLRRIKQMAMAYLVYPGAVHTRFQHSLGAYHLMCNAIEELRQKGIEITGPEEQAAKIAILLHDVGHGPYSHALEATLVNVNHEAISILIMEHLNEKYNGALSLALQIFLDKHPKKFLHQLVSSQLDVDRLDYLARDSFFTGVSEGVISYDRIIKMLNVHNDELLIEEKGVLSVEKYLIARRLMYWQVYLHKTVLSSEKLLVKILQRAKELYKKGEVLFASPALQFFLENTFTLNDFKNNKACLQNFILLDDYDLLSAIKVWTTSTDKILADLSAKLINRNLYKTYFSSNEDVLFYNSKINEVKTTLNLTNDDVHYYVITDVIGNIAYSPNDEKINIWMKDGSIQEISTIEHSLISKQIGEAVKKYYICYPK
jgi:uncharacterized protein